MTSKVLLPPYLEFDPWLNVTVFPFTVRRVPAGELSWKLYMPDWSMNSTPVYRTAKLYFLAAAAVLMPLKLAEAACKIQNVGYRFGGSNVAKCAQSGSE